MAKFAKNNLKRSSALSMVAGRSEKYSADITQDTNLSDMSESQRIRIRFLKDEQLLDDPDNVTIYGSNYQIENLSEVMKEYGFQGVLLAYPIEDGKYRIESGHRRRLAGRKAGIKEFPVLITQTPKTDAERKRRLFGANLLSREENPIITARIADNLFSVFKEEYKYKKANGLLEKDEDGNIIETGDITKKVSLFMNMDARTITKYRTLLKLNQELQNLAFSKEYSWTALSDASTLSDEKQKELYTEIKSSDKPVTKAWIIRRCRELKEEEVKEASENKDSSKAKASGYLRPKYAPKKITNYASNLSEVLKDEYLIPDKDIDAMINILDKLKSQIDQKLTVLQNKKTSSE